MYAITREFRLFYVQIDTTTMKFQNLQFMNPWLIDGGIDWKRIEIVSS